MWNDAKLKVKQASVGFPHQGVKVKLIKKKTHHTIWMTVQTLYMSSFWFRGN